MSSGPTVAAPTVRIATPPSTSISAASATVTARSVGRTDSTYASCTGRISARHPSGTSRAPARTCPMSPGVSVVDGRYVYVRGLGDRYGAASLNGAPLPSPEPDRKVVPLDIVGRR